MYVYRYLLVCRLEAKRVNLCTKKHIDICVAIMDYNILYFETEDIVKASLADHAKDLSRAKIATYKA
jgi:hypothetical protein